MWALYHIAVLVDNGLAALGKLFCIIIGFVKKYFLFLFVSVLFQNK